MINWLRKIMYGRYGSDALNVALLVLSLVFMGVGEWRRSPLLTLLAIPMLLACCFRIFSRDYPNRARENEKFLFLWGPINRKLMHLWAPIQQKISKANIQFKDRKTHRYYSCPQCKSTLRVPRGKGKIKISCPKCGHQFVSKS